ncbi:hypothetical protein [Desulfotomaculum copahuensis]|uniref:Uncharacterized protein n=1 Tax=Desulfotomaculum copahuensis TaxID=1838280 RepID=A0A1B7LHL4_9FIRM|nr:hypothetical protein [Desulfotomaculum copahuensis]OAT85607.1 hypothetical protein A6M21_05695 [Desulfotomaculum copahuensis]
MSGEPLDLQEKRLLKALEHIYRLQKCHFFAEEIMPGVMKELKLSDTEAIELVKALIDKGWLSTKGFLPRLFFRPENIAGFPVVVSAAGLARLRRKN